MSTATAQSTTVEFPLADFRDAFTAVARAVPGKAARPALQAVKLELKEDFGILTATNMELWIEKMVPVNYEQEPVSVLLPRATVGEVLRHAQGDTITLEVAGRRLKLSTATASWNLTTSDPDLFPAPPEVTTDSYLEVASDRLLLAIKRTIREARPGEERGFTKDAVQFEPPMLGLTLTTANGRSLAHQKVEAVSHGAFGDGALPLVPESALRTLAALLENDDSPVQVSFPSRNWVRFWTPGMTLVARQAEGRFTEWRGPVQGMAKPAGAVTVPAGALKRTIASAAVSLDDNLRALEFYFNQFDGGGALVISSESGSGQSEASLDLEWISDPLVVHLDPQYLLPMLSSLKDETSVTLSLWSDKQPIRLTTEDGFLGFVSTMEPPARTS